VSLFHPVETRRTFEEAIDQIAYAVRVGDLRVGDRLPSERALAAAMEISRPTLREAIAVLKEADVVKVVAGTRGGMIIQSEVIPATLLDRGIQLRVEEVASVLEARRMIEPQVAQLAGVYATNDNFRRMRRAIEEQRAARNIELSGQWDERFHIQIARATGNPTIAQIMRGLLRKLAIAWDMDYHIEHAPERGVEMHEQTLAALMSRDPVEIDEVMDRHLSILEVLWEDETGRPRLRRFPQGVARVPASVTSAVDRRRA
jgi:GntR family transcriptional regulator, transcriptional repressor for pyruvate dehydrogenase complex